MRKATTTPDTITASSTEVQLDLMMTLERLIEEADRARVLRDRLIEMYRTVPTPRPAPARRTHRRSARAVA